MPKNKVYDKILPILPAIITAILITSDFDIKIDTSVKADTILLILGNFAIAYYIAVQINKKHKNEELIKDNCFKEIDFLLESFEALREAVKKSSDDDLDDFIVRFDSLTSLQIDLIKKYNFISHTHKEQLSDHFYKLNKYLTDENSIHQNYKIELLRLEETLLNIKNSILEQP